MFHRVYQYWLCPWLTRTARSACDAPPIMLGTKLLWPGASRMVKCFLSVSKYARPTSTVFPLSLSSWLVSKAQDRYLRDTQWQASCQFITEHIFSVSNRKCWCCINNAASWKRWRDKVRLHLSSSVIGQSAYSYISLWRLILVLAMTNDSSEGIEINTCHSAYDWPLSVFEEL